MADAGVSDVVGNRADFPLEEESSFAVRWATAGAV